MSDHESGSGSHEQLRAYGTAHDLAEEAERFSESTDALCGEALAAVVVGARDGVLSSSDTVSLANRLRALRVEAQAVARQMAEASAEARKGAE